MSSCIWMISSGNCGFNGVLMKSLNGVLMKSYYWLLELVKTNCVNPLSVNPSKWVNTLKQFVGKLPWSCLYVFDHFVLLAQGLRMSAFKFLCSSVDKTLDIKWKQRRLQSLFTNRFFVAASEICKLRLKSVAIVWSENMEYSSWWY